MVCRVSFVTKTPGSSGIWKRAHACLTQPQRRPGSAAVTWATESDATLRSWSIDELRGRCGLLAHALRAAGVDATGRVAGVLPLSADAVALYLATILAGCAWVSIAESCELWPA